MVRAQPIISIKDVSFVYPGSRFEALSGINLDLNAGEFIIVTGGNGSGKTTLCKCINALIPYSSGGEFDGKVEVCGVNTLMSSTSDLAAHVGFVLSNPEDQLVTPKVNTELAFGLENLSCPKEEILEKIDRILEEFEITDLAQSSTFNLSTGQMQLIAIASFVIMEPEVLILDDPLSHLNRNLCQKVISIVSKLHSKGTTIIWISQDVADIFHLAERIIVMDRAKIVFNGTPEEFIMLEDVSEFPTIFPQHIELSNSLISKGFSRNLLSISLEETVINFRKYFSKEKIARRSITESEETIEEPARIDILEPAPKRAPMITISGLNFKYSNGFQALYDINLTFNGGDFVLLTGWNGAGKTTLVKHLNGLLRSSESRVTIDGEDIFDVPTSILAQKVGFLFQNPDHQLNKPTVHEELSFSLRNFNYQQEEINRRVEQISRKLNLTELLNKSPQELTSSEKKLVTIGSVLIHEPKILIMDEATANLDKHQSRNIIQIMEDYYQEERVIITISHDVMMWAESKLINRVIVMELGRIIADGTPEAILTDNRIMNYLMDGLLPVTRIAHELPDQIIKDMHFSIGTILPCLLQIFEEEYAQKER